MRVRRYLFPRTVKDCLEKLESASGKARIVAGGTDLMLLIQRGECCPDLVVDITRIAELEGIALKNGNITLGARVTHAECASSTLIRESAACLAEACGSIGSPQVRYIASLAGNVVNAQPAADAAIALVALGARAKIISLQGEREEVVEDLYRGPGLSRVDSTRELLAELHFPQTHTGEGTAFLRVTMPNGMGLPVLNGAAWISIHQTKIVDLRMALGPVSDRPFRLLHAEALLRGSGWGDATLLENAARVASEEANPRDSLLRGSAAYRKELIEILVNRLLQKAIGRTRGESIPLTGSIVGERF